MATPADQRLLDLLAKWLTSLELHAKYCSLDDDTYSKIQAWPDHQRPSRWIIDLARQKALALRGQVEERIKAGDAKFSESLELMTFLANLVGSEHIERFIPLAEPQNERTPEPADGQPADASAATREMPRFAPAKSSQPPPVGTATVARTERKAGEPPAVAAKPPAKSGQRQAKPAPVPADPAAGARGAAGGAPENAKSAAAARKSGAPAAGHAKSEVSDAAREQVIADAARLVQWGRKWYELAELIASMSDRPHLTDVRRILKDNKAVIDEKAGRA